VTLCVLALCAVMLRAGALAVATAGRALTAAPLAVATGAGEYPQPTERIK
jgi:hypothetical protein